MINKHKHLDLVSAVIGRMAQNSFTVRGWCITVVTAIVAFGVEADSPGMVLASLIPLLVFWATDAYYLRQERAFRRLYDVVRILPEKDIDFDMTPTYVDTVAEVMLKSSVFAFLYLGLAFATVAISLVVWLSASVAPT